MEHLPPVGWADVTTKHDLDIQSALLRSDFEAHRAETKHDFDSFRAKTKQEFSVLRIEIENSELRLRTEIGQLRVDMAERSNRLLFQLLASMAGFVSLVLVLGRIG